MIIAFVCPDTYADIDTIEKELAKNENVTKILSGTTHAYNMSKGYAEKHGIAHHRETCKGKENRLKRIVMEADKIVAFQEKDRDISKYSRTEIALSFATEYKKEVSLFLYDDLESEC